MATTSDPVSNFLARFGLRDVGHFGSVFVATFFATINLTSVNAARASALAALGAAATVTFRQVFPHQSLPAPNVVAVVQAIPPTPGA